ncbi:unnamed protein product [Ascophyllum nodosum]
MRNTCPGPGFVHQPISRTSTSLGSLGSLDHAANCSPPLAYNRRRKASPDPLFFGVVFLPLLLLAHWAGSCHHVVSRLEEGAGQRLRGGCRRDFIYKYGVYSTGYVGEELRTSFSYLYKFSDSHLLV